MPQRFKPRHLIIALELIILLLALGVRVANFKELFGVFPNFLEKEPFCGLDGIAYHRIYALGILKGDWPGDEPFFHMILYPYFLAAVYALVGVSLRFVVFIHILLEVLACAVLYAIGRLIFNQMTGLLASFFMAFYAPLIFFNPCYAQEVLSVPLFVLTLYLLLKARTSRNLIYLIIASVMTGLAGLSRPTYFLLVPIVFAWWFMERVRWQRLAWHGLIYGGLVFLVTLPATLHNYRTDGHFSPTPISGWEIFFLGNNPVAEGMGTLDYVLYTQTDLPGEAYIVSVVERAKAAKKGAPEVYRDEAFKFIRSNPLAWLDLMGRKSYLLLGETDSNIISPYFFHNLQTVWFLRYFPFEWRSMFIAALLGMALLKHKHRSLLLLLVILLPLFTIFFHIQYRFRLLLVPLIVLYAAALIVAAPRLGRPRFIIAMVSLGLICLFLPALGWLFALFVISALWALAQRRDWRLFRWATLAAWSYLVVGLLVAQIIAFTGRSEQRQSIFLGIQISGPVALGQSFVVHCAGFNQLSLVMGDYGNSHARPATLHLRAGLDSVEDIYNVTFDAGEIKDRIRRDFTFPTQTNSANKRYFVYVEAPLAAAAEAITLRGTYDQPFDRYREGSAYAGQPGNWQELAGDLAFKASCNTGWLNLVHQTFQQLAVTGLGSAPVYWAIFIAHFGLLIVALWKLGVLIGCVSNELTTWLIVKRKA
jgi:hypothetical protein